MRKDQPINTLICRWRGQVLSISSLTESRILIVDDQPENLRALSTVLDLRGYRDVRCLDDSRHVVPVFLDYQPDLILLDLHMPHVDGITVMDQLGEVIAKDDYLPILVLTGDSTPAARERALSHGAHDFISKPLNRTEVQLRVKNLLQTRSLHLQRKAQNASLEEANRKLRETQTHLVQSEKMASLGQLVAGIAHEVNNPLAFVINNLFLAQEGLDGLAAEPLGNIGPQTEMRVERLRYANPQFMRGCGTGKGSGVQAQNLFAPGRRRIQDGGHSREHRIGTAVFAAQAGGPHRGGAELWARRTCRDCFAGELNQVLMNVIANAIDSIEGQGKVTLTTMQQDEHFVIVVRDTGKGIPEAIRSKVFEPFFTTKPVGHGTGLGLAISYGIVKAHRGSIDFSSEPGKGTAFVLKIPTGLRAET